MNSNTTKTSKELKKSFPRSILSVSREEFGLPEDNPDAKNLPLKLLVKDGKILPEGLHGHVFIIGPVGSVDSESHSNPDVVFPSSDGYTPLYNGDGMVYRLDFNNLKGGVFLTSRIMKTPCYYADKETNKNFTSLIFKNLGILRFSENLGIRNQLNTSLMRMKFFNDKDERLLISWDIGRPYEIDTKTLELATPVGYNKEWFPMNSFLAGIPFKPPFPFQLVHSSAHPCFDFETKELLTVNLGRPVSSFLSQLNPLIEEIFKLINLQFLADLLSQLKGYIPILKIYRISHLSLKKLYKEHKRYLDLESTIIKPIAKFLITNILFSKKESESLDDFFVHLISWDGQGKLKKWNLTWKGKPIKIQQSIHQIGISEDYVVLVETAFKFLLAELLPPHPAKQYEKVVKIIRNLINLPQLPNTNIYIVRRADLKPENKNVEVLKVIIPREITHFLADYKNPDGQLTLHVGHLCAWDPAEWIRNIDFEDSKTVTKQNDKQQTLYGTIVGPMDISRLGCYTFQIDSNKAKMMRSDLTEIYRKDKSFTEESNTDYYNYTWGPELYACQDNPPSGKFEDIYWAFLGCWEDILTQHSIQMYSSYKYREISVAEMIEITKKGIKANLLHLHIKPLDGLKDGESRLEVTDVYEFENGYLGTSPQFIPRAGANGSSTDGYIMCVVFYGTDDEADNGNQIWIFDAANLKQGPLCKLWHPQLNFGLTVHTTWLPKISKRTAGYNIPVEDDYKDLVAKQPAEIQELFEKEIYPHFKSKPTD